jgi:hypothetical protein
MQAHGRAAFLDPDFTAGAVVAGMGVETLRRVRTRRELIVGALPQLARSAVAAPQRITARDLIARDSTRGPFAARAAMRAGGRFHAGVGRSGH